MDQFPTEILSQIFPELTFTAKVNFASTCKKWRDFIRDSTLYQDLTVDGTSHTSAFKNFFEDHPEYRDKVHSLHLSSTDIEISAVLALPVLFPELKELVWDGEYKNGAKSDEEESDDSDDDDGFFVSRSPSGINFLEEYEKLVDAKIAESWNSITSFEEADHYPLTATILEYGGFCNLINLDVDLDDDDHSGALLIKQLMKAPKLKTLRLSHGKMSLQDFDELCSNAQQLETLQLSKIDITGPNETSTVSATFGNLERLQIDTCKGENTGKILMRMSGKCPNLKSLKVYPEYGDRNWDDEGAHLATFVSGCPHLKCYDVDFFPVTPDILAAMNKNGIKLEAITTEPEELPKQIKDLLASNQKNFIDAITLNCSLLSSFTDTERQELFNALQGFPKLKCLAIKSNGKYDVANIPINGFLQHCHNLETISLLNCKPELVSGASDNFTTKLKHLILENTASTISINGKVTDFISKTCPDLTMLDINFPYNTDNEIEFTNHKFTCIKLHCISYICDKRQFYNVKNTQGTKVYRMNYGTLEEYTKPPWNRINVSLSYASCDKLKIEEAYVLDP
ncbi:hypothetical protein [Parasitella parasitica]|uniref:F-box domain-containing protein n=1 Tax=Parasitella parasitica TaxID=35722 RepID=A0A0B7MND6_9FUNG|nr:hypothetical protein [Parasitella parasitica]